MTQEIARKVFVLTDIRVVEEPYDWVLDIGDWRHHPHPFGVCARTTRTPKGNLAWHRFCLFCEPVTL